jgi:hypothetical protein
VELKSFVAETLSQIIEGIKEAQQRAQQGAGGVVNPPVGRMDRQLLTTNRAFFSQAGLAQFVDFDVAVTATEGTATKGGVGVMVAAITLGTSGQSTAENSATSRVKFSVPIALPPDAKQVPVKHHDADPPPRSKGWLERRR